MPGGGTLWSPHTRHCNSTPTITQVHFEDLILNFNIQGLYHFTLRREQSSGIYSERFFPAGFDIKENNGKKTFVQTTT